MMKILSRCLDISIQLSALGGISHGTLSIVSRSFSIARSPSRIQHSSCSTSSTRASSDRSGVGFVASLDFNIARAFSFRSPIVGKCSFESHSSRFIHAFPLISRLCPNALTLLVSFEQDGDARDRRRTRRDGERDEATTERRRRRRRENERGDFCKSGR